MGSRFLPATFSAAVSVSLLLSGCGSLSKLDVWPFGGDKKESRSGPPANATEFQCDGGKRFYVRYLENGAAAWLILPDREVRFDKVAADSGMRYSNGNAVLEVHGSEATLAVGAAVSFTGCKAVGK